MPTNRVTGNAKDGIVVLRVQRDKEWDRIQVAERIELPYADTSQMTNRQKLVYMAMIEGAAKAAGKLAIERYEKLRHWKFDGSIAPVLDVSEAQIDLDDFSSSTQKDFVGVSQGSLLTKKGMKAYVLRMWFIAPKIEVQQEIPEEHDPEVTDGFVNPYKMSAHYKFKDGK